MRDVCFSCDDNGAKFLCVTAWSLLKHYRGAEPLRINVFEGFGGHSAESKAKLKAIVDEFNEVKVKGEGEQRNLSSLTSDFAFFSLRYHSVEKAVEPYADLIMNRERSRWNVFTWTPIFTPLLLSDATGNVAHFDIDMLFNDDVSKILDLDLGDDLIAAVAEYGKGDPVITEAVWGKGILPPEAERYFNTGTIVFNTAKCREEKTWEKILAWYREHYDIADRIEQDAWNALYWKRTKHLPLRWNFHDRLIKSYVKWDVSKKYWQGNPPQECLEAALNPAILHFWGPKKPWKPCHRPYRHLYHAAMRAVGQTPPKEGLAAVFHNSLTRWCFSALMCRRKKISYGLPESAPAVTTDRFHDVVYSSNDDGVRFMAVSVYSLLSRYRGGGTIRINVLEGFGGLSASSHELLQCVVGRFPFAKLRFVNLDPLVKPVAEKIRPKEGSRWVIFAWMPVFAPDLLPDVSDNLLYLDVDTLVNADVSPLFSLDLGTNVAAAVYENHYHAGASSQNVEWNLGILPPAAKRYFNDGVLVFNTSLYRREKCLEALLDWYGKNADRAFRIEQDALNAVFWNRVLPLHPKWNYHDRTIRKYCLKRRTEYWDGNSPSDCLEAALNPAILHFWGKKKPWNPSHRPYRHLYHSAMRAVGLEVPPEQPSAFINNFINDLAIRLIALRRYS